jgi:hypothetical protein
MRPRPHIFWCNVSVNILFIGKKVTISIQSLCKVVYDNNNNNNYYYYLKKANVLGRM